MLFIWRDTGLWTENLVRRMAFALRNGLTLVIEPGHWADIYDILVAKKEMMRLV